MGKLPTFTLVRDSLAAVLGLPHCDDLHAVRTIFANDHRPNPSIVFLHRTQHGKVEGATLRDTRQQSSFRPSLGNKLIAWFTVGHLDKAEIVIAGRISH